MDRLKFLGENMDLWDSICDNIICPLGSVVGDTLETMGRGIDSVVSTVVIDGVCGGLDKVVDVVVENPKTSIAVVATAATGGVALLAAGPIAATVGGAGLLGTTSTGTVISTLSGAALTNASLAAIGGGSLAAGGAGIAGGTAVIAATGAATGAVVSGGAIAVTSET